MPKFILNKETRQLLASCIEVGFEGAFDHDDEDLGTIGAIIDELRESEADETVLHIAPTPLYEREIAGGLVPVYMMGVGSTSRRDDALDREPPLGLTADETLSSLR